MNHLATSVLLAATITLGFTAVPADAALASVRSDLRTPAADGSIARRAEVLTGLARTRSAVDTAAYLHRHADALSTLQAGATSSHTVRGWWDALDESDRSHLEAAASDLLGNLGGVPYPVRARLNERELTERITRAEKSLSAQKNGPRAARTRCELGMLQQVREALVVPAGGQPRSLIAFDTTDGGRAEIAVGDIATADYVTVLVPGMFFSVDAQIVDWTATAERLATEQSSSLAELGRSGSVAAVAWIGYRTPGLGGVLNLSLACRGADALERDLVAIRTTRAEAEPHLTVVAHSYGSTAALLALQRGTVQVDALALLGTPGSDARSVAALDVAKGGVYVGEAAWDPIAGSRFFGNDPGLPAFGGTRIATSAGIDPLDGRTLGASAGHNEYFAPGSQSLRNLALIGIDRGGLVTEVGDPTSRSRRPKLLRSW